MVELLSEIETVNWKAELAEHVCEVSLGSFV